MFSLDLSAVFSDAPVRFAAVLVALGVILRVVTNTARRIIQWFRSLTAWMDRVETSIDQYQSIAPIVTRTEARVSKIEQRLNIADDPCPVLDCPLQPPPAPPEVAA